jgi:hypothetical protein
MKKHLTIGWAGGTSCLLTWPNENTQPIGRNFSSRTGALRKQAPALVSAKPLSSKRFAII